MTSDQLPWQRTKSVKTSTKFQFCKLSEKLIRSPTIFISLLIGKFPGNMEKSYLVELNIFKENARADNKKLK